MIHKAMKMSITTAGIYTCMKKLPVNAQLEGHHHHQSLSMFTPSVHLFESVMGPFEILNLDASVLFLKRGVVCVSNTHK